jgi:hypothetical protein
MGYPRAMVVLKRISPGSYMTPDGRYLVARYDSGWRWTDTQMIGVGGDWRSRKKDAVLDLADYLGTNVVAPIDLPNGG